MAWGEHQAEDANTENDAAYPLHFMIESAALGIPVRDIEGAIRDAYSRNPTLIHQKDDRGFTPLHAGAYAANLPAVKALLALPAEANIAEDAHARDNVAARTPVELCEQKMRDLKEMMQSLIGNWPGHSEDALRVVFLLKRAAGENIAVTEDAFVAARKWGCTCGQCTDGWLSPRMRYRLLSTCTLFPREMLLRCGTAEAEISSDGMQMNTWDATSAGSFEFDLAVGYLPPEVRKRVTKAVYRDYTSVVRAITEVLKKPEAAGLPTAANVQAELLGRAGYFFGKGGKVEHAMDYVLHSAMEQSPLGDGTWDDLQEECAAEGSHGPAAYAAMPKCDNDLEFLCVANRLALGTVDRYRSGGGGYDDSDDDDEMDEDEEDDM